MRAEPILLIYIYLGTAGLRTASIHRDLLVLVGTAIFKEKRMNFAKSKLSRAILAGTSGTLSLMAVAIIASPVALAEDDGWYIGGNVGYSQADIDDERINSSLLGSGFSSTTISEDDNSTDYKIFGGYQVNRYFAMEAGFFELGDFGYTASTVPPGTLTGEILVRGINFDLVGILPISDKFSAFARAGVTRAETEADFSGTGAVNVINANPSEYDNKYKYGVGVEYKMTESLGLRAEAERYRINDAVGNDGDVDMFSAGLVYRFGATSEPVVAAAPTPEPVAVIAPPPEPRRVSFSADTMFDFDKDTVKPAGKQELDKLAADLSDSNFEVITVTGHTDRIGSHDYNMDLSARRAEAVKRYLVETGGLPASKITTNGIDGAEPVTQPDDCIGTKRTQALIDCLAPDRRVEVEVRGTQQ